MKTAMKSAPGKYERVGEQKGPLNLGGALAKMEEDPDIVYVPKHHVVGTKKEITEWLKEKHPDENVKSVLANSYSKDTLENPDVMQAFEQEIKLAQKDREQSRAHRDTLRTMNLDFLTTFIQTYEKEQRSRPKAERTVVDSRQVKTADTLKKKVKALKDENKVLDVTNMKKTGKDARKLSSDEKELGSRKRLAQSDTVAFFHVVYNPANKSAADGVRNFLKLYGGFETDKISAIVEQVKAGSDINIGVAKSPTRVNLLTPTRRKPRSKREVDSELLDE